MALIDERVRKGTSVKCSRFNFPGGMTVLFGCICACLRVTAL